MATTNLSIARLIAVAVNLASLPAQAQSTSNLMILGTSGVIDTVERFRTYTSLNAVATDFGTSAEEYLAANLFFQQAPQPASLQIGAWAKTATKGQLKCGTLTATNSLLATWNAVAAGSAKFSINGTQTDVTGMNFTAATSLNGVAAIIQTALNGVFAGATCTYDSSFNRFVVSSSTTGGASAAGFLVAAASGTDISVLMSGRSTNGGYLVAGQVAETALAAATLFDTNYGQQWYAMVIPAAVDADHLAVAGMIQASANKHAYGITSQDASILTTGTADIAYLLKQLAYTRSTVQYSSSSPCAVCSLLGRILTVNYSGNNTVITLMYKTEPGVVAETLNATQIGNLEGKYANAFVAYNNSTAIIEKGTVASGDFLDTIIGVDWLALQVQTALYNQLYTTPTKVPQTDAGNQILVTAAEDVLSDAVNNGLLAPGVWQQAGFGAIAQGDFLPKGFYTYAPPIATQSQADRAARKSVPIQIAAKLAGAIQTVDVTINVNR